MSEIRIPVTPVPETSPILTAAGRPQPASTTAPCPRCGAPRQARVQAAAFGTRSQDAICGRCGAEWGAWMS